MQKLALILQTSAGRHLSEERGDRRLEPRLGMRCRAAGDHLLGLDEDAVLVGCSSLSNSPVNVVGIFLRML